MFFFKSILENTLNCKIYGKSLPRGTDIFYDLNKIYGINNFQTVFDIGANIGQSAISYAKQFPNAQIFSFEPVSTTFAQLKQNTQTIGSRLHLFNCAMGKESGKVEINLNTDSKLNSIVYGESNNKEIIEVDTIDNFRNKHSINVIDFLKIDTEGFEIEVLKGAKQTLREQKIGVLYIESEPFITERRFVPFQDLANLLLGFNYQLFGIYEQQPHWTANWSQQTLTPITIRFAQRCSRSHSLDINERIGKAATLHQLGRIYANKGEVDQAIALFNQSLDINERIGNVQGKAMTLWWLGGLAKQQGDYNKAISYLQPALEILQKLKSPDAERVQAMLERIQNHIN